jgi:carboxypeptidase C (cathepsin A)
LTTVPTLYQNPYSWTKLSTMLYFEHPTGVGFSYCQSCLGNATCHCQANDNTAAEDNYEAVVAFFKLFPEFSKNDMYITGESYAGIYISMLMGQVMQKGGVPNLKGAAIGNGCTGTKKGACSGDRAPYLAELYYGNGLYSSELRKRLLAGCSADWHSDAVSAALELRP